LQIGLDQQVVLPHHPKYALLIDGKLLHEVQIRPDPPVPPKRMLSLKRLDVGEPACITLRHRGRPPPRQPRSSSLFLSSRVRSPTSVFSRAVSRTKRVSFRWHGWTSKALEAFARNWSRH